MSEDKKYDAGKVDMELLFLQFPLALQAVPWAAMYGAVKYDDDSGTSYKKVSKGQRRYESAGSRHKLKRKGGELFDLESHVLHHIHEVWNALASLEFALMGGARIIDPRWETTYEEDWKKQAEEIKAKQAPARTVFREPRDLTAAKWSAIEFAARMAEAPTIESVEATTTKTRFVEPGEFEELRRECTCDGRDNIKYCDGYCER